MSAFRLSFSTFNGGVLHGNVLPNLVWYLLTHAACNISRMDKVNQKEIETRKITQKRGVYMHEFSTLTCIYFNLLGILKSKKKKIAIFFFVFRFAQNEKIFSRTEESSFLFWDWFYNLQWCMRKSKNLHTKRFICTNQHLLVGR